MSKITINGNVTGSHAQVGDINNYATPLEFYNTAENINYTNTEKQLVELIYENTSSEEEREKILNSLRTLKENEGSVGHEESNKENGGRIKDFLMALGTDTAAKIIVELGSHLLNGAH